MVIKLPLYIDLPRVKDKPRRVYLSQNCYRNLHYHVSNQAKVAFKNLVMPQILPLPKMGKVHLHYTIYPKTNRPLDVSNYCSVADKFFCDALVAAGKIVDDSFIFIPEISYSFGGIDKLNPRIDCEIVEY